MIRSCLFSFLGLSLLFPFVALAGDYPNFGEEAEHLAAKHSIDFKFNGNILIRKGEFNIFEVSYGLANREHTIYHGPQSKFLIGSVSKQVTAAAIMVLQQQGRLNVQDPVMKYLTSPQPKALPTFWSQVTIEHLLTHTAGLQEDLNGEKTPRGERNQLSTITAAILSSSSNFNQGTKVGVDFSYSNMGYVLLAQIIEQITSRSYEDFLKKELLDKMGARNTGEYHRLKILKHQAEGYYKSPHHHSTIFRRCCVDATNLRGSHSLYSTTHDMNRWLRSLFSPSISQNILSEESIQAMITPRVSVSGIQTLTKPTQYGYGLYLDKFEGYDRIFHSGETYGYLSLISYIPHLDITIIILSNFHKDLGDPNSIYTYKMHDQFTKAILKHYK